MYAYERVLEYLKKNGSITQNECSRYCGSSRLAVHISRLKEKGYNITCEMERDGRNKFGEKCVYGRYKLNG